MLTFNVASNNRLMFIVADDTPKVRKRLVEYITGLFKGLEEIGLIGVQAVCVVRHFAQINFPIATAVSAMRFEKPHSLSYQAITRTSVPFITLV